MELQSIEFSEYMNYPLEPIPNKEGVFQRVIARAEDGIGIVHIVEYVPGTDLTPYGVQSHKFWEYVFILEGSMIDLTLGREFKKGSVAVRMPGMKHGPWKIPEGGCKLFEIKCMQPL